MQVKDKIIGFGPGICGYSANYKPPKSTKSNRIYNILKRKYIEYVARPNQEKKYVQSISFAINSGFNWIDYSCAYGDGRLLGKAIKQSESTRELLTITTRISNYSQFNHCVREEFFNFLHNTGLEYVDILQFHWPVTHHYLDTWKVMESLHKEGYVKYLGVANCHQHHLEEIFKICKYKPEIGQFEIHPLFTQKPLIEFYKQHDIQVCAYTPIARFDDRLMRLPLLKQISMKFGKSITQIILRWHIQNNVIPIVRSLNPIHLVEDLDIFDFELSDEDMNTIDKININSRLRYDPDNCDFNIL